MIPCNLDPSWSWVIVIVVALLLFGGTRLAGIGKSAGKAIREFKEETTAMKNDGSGAIEDSPKTPSDQPTNSN